MSDEDGRHKGDVLITLPGNMARRMDDYMKMVGTECPAGELSAANSANAWRIMDWSSEVQKH